MLTGDGELTDKVNDFNKFFANVGKQTFEKSQHNLPNYSNTPQLNTDPTCTPAGTMFRPQPTDSNTIILVIKQLRNTSSCGSDGIPLRFLKESLPVIIPYLTCILNTSIVTGCFPSLWKHAIVVPIYKTGDVNEPKNYRPISLLPIISKILEKVIARQLTLYLEENHLLSSTQHGFRASLSTDSALLKLSDKLYENSDTKQLSLITLCDLSKAFDSINHKMLLKKLITLKIDSFWFDSYLHRRTQAVRIGKHTSQTMEVSYGVPQGSVLGPILFLIFVNDLSQCISDCFIIQYADDTQFIHTGSIDRLQDLIHRGEETMLRAKYYFNSNGLLLNTNKTQCMFVGSRGLISQIPSNTTLQVDGATIVPSSSLKNLGIYFDQNMTFDSHVNKISGKIFSTIIYINRIKDNFSKSARKTVMQSLVLSIINYGIKVWGTTNKTHMYTIQKLQNFAAKVALGGAAKHEHATPFLRELGWLRIKEKYMLELGIMMYNVTRSSPNAIYHMPLVSELSTVNTRQQQQLYVPKYNTCTGARSTLVAGPRLWNSLPPHIRDAHSLYTFKNQLFLHLLKQQFKE